MNIKKSLPKRTFIHKAGARRMGILIALLLTLNGMFFSVSHALAGTGSGERAPEVSYAALDTYLAQQLDMLNIPGASLAIIEGDQIVHTQGFGVTGPGGAAPTPQTPFFIGSLTKSVTALAIMQLVEAGKVDLDAPVQRYLPWFTLADPQAAVQITPRHLLNQTSGLTMVPGMINLSNFDTATGAMERQARALANFELTRPVGSAFEYSNLNFNLLGLIVEAASGETYANYVQRLIFNPLDMRHSYAYKSAAQQAGLAVGHQMWFGSPVAVPGMPVPEGSLPSGQIIASAEDMAHFLIAQLNGGTYAGVRVLSPAGVTQMHTPAAPVSLGEQAMGDYGMGWFIITPGQKKLIFHDGEVPDFFAYMAILPEEQRGMVLLVNANQQMYNYALWTTAENAALMLAGVPPKSNAWGILPWAMRGMLLLPIFQVVLIAATLRRVKRWRIAPSSRPGPARKWLLHILLPTLLNLAMVAIPVALLASGLFQFITFYLGDLVVLFSLAGAIALVWLCVRTLLITRG